jgi:hypothetical protein
MWLINIATDEEGYHICQENQKEPCDLLVFVQNGGLWKVKLWKSTETRIRANNYEEEQKDIRTMRDTGFPFGLLPHHSIARYSYVKN